MDGPSRTDGRDTFRPDIEGLRGVAILLVVLYHSSLVIGIPGGFIGVDVFFVISGFLITGLLLRERERTGRISLADFYARRVRRLLPAASWPWPHPRRVVRGARPLDRAAVAVDAAAAALSVGNLRFALAEGDYFAADDAVTGAPLLVARGRGAVLPGVARARARGNPGARARLGAIALAFVLGASLSRTSWSGDRRAGVLLPAARAWQLSLGGLVAVRPSRSPGPRPAVGASAGWRCGAAAARWRSTAASPTPARGRSADAGGGALIVSGRGVASRALLALWPLRFLGRISFSLYLWHWPALVLPLIALEAEPPQEMRAVPWPWRSAWRG